MAVMASAEVVNEPVLRKEYGGAERRVRSCIART